MRPEEVVERLRCQRGAVRVELMPDDLCRRIVEEESTVSGGMGTIRIHSPGLEECMARDVRICVFEDLGFWHPDSRTMLMVDEAGNTVGHDLARSEILEFMKRSDVVFLSDDFVMYLDVEAVGDTTMEMLPIPYTGEGGWIPGSQDPVLWYPSTTSDAIIREYFGQPMDGTATGMLALNVE